MDRKKMRLFDWCVSALLGLGAFTVYLFTLSSGAAPGRPVFLVVQLLDILPRLDPRNPMWWLAANGAMKLPVAASVVTRINLLSAVCGAVSVGGLYHLMVGLIRASIHADREQALMATIAARIAGIGSALFLAFSIPFWTAATRSLPLTFDIACLLVLGLLLLRYMTHPTAWMPCLIGFLFGVGTVEFSTIILFVPLFAAAILWSMWEREELRPKQLLAAALAGIAGLFLYPIVAAVFFNSDGYHLREYEGFFKILWILWRDQYYELTRSLPRVGWLIVVLVTVTPALTVPVVARRALNGEKDWGFYLLHLVLTVLAVGVLLNVRFAPWSMSGGRLQVAPYLIHACLFGYLLAYWLMLPLAWWEKPDATWQKGLRMSLGWVIILPGVVAVAVAPFRNVSTADGRVHGFMNRYAHRVLDSLEGREWLVTDGSLDGHIQIAAHERGMAVNVLNLYAQPQHISLRVVLEKLPSASLRNLAGTGVMTLVHEWLRTRPEAASEIAMMPVPDFWVGADMTVLPNKLVFLGASDETELDAAALLAEHTPFWEELRAELDATASTESGERLLAHLRRHAGFVANNLGYLLQDLGDDASAFEAYSASRRIDSSNVSALLNQASMVSKGFVTEDAEVVKRDFAALKNQRGSSLRALWSLARHYGYVRSADAFGQAGLTWAMSGRPGIAVSGLKTALELATGEDRQRMQLTLADVYYSQEEGPKSEELYKEVLADDPRNADALLGMARLKRSQRDLVAAEQFLKRLDATGKLRRETAMQWALLNLAAGDVVQARIVLEELVGLRHEETRAWELLGRIALSQGDVTGVRDAIANLRSVRGSDGSVYALEAELALRERDVARAHSYLSRALRAMPRSVRLHERILRLGIAQRQMADARGHALALLKLDPENAWANYALGSIHYHEGEVLLAEDAFRRSLAQERLPAALNDLAHILLTARDDAAGAEALARESVERDPRPHNGWDTLAMALMEQGKLDEAETVLSEAVKRTRSDPYVFFHSAKLFVLQGEMDRARALLSMLKQSKETVPDDLVQQIDELRREIGNAQPKSEVLEP